MRIAAVIGASILGLLVGTTTLANAQHGREDGRESGSQKQHGNKHQEERGRSSVEHSDRHHANGPERREQHAHETHRANQDRSERQRAHDRSEHGPERMNEARWHEREQHSRPRDVWEDHRAQHWQREHHSWRERGGYRGYRIPEDRFRAHFGRGHWFRVHSVPIIVVDGHPRFQYAGFWVSLVDPWPEYWSRTWYETDDVYVDYVSDGYYMYNRRHPGVAIAVNVSF